MMETDDDCNRQGAGVAARPRWFAFGFNAFGQLGPSGSDPRELCVTRPRRLTLGAHETGERRDDEERQRQEEEGEEEGGEDEREDEQAVVDVAPAWGSAALRGSRDVCVQGFAQGGRAGPTRVPLADGAQQLACNDSCLVLVTHACAQVWEWSLALLPPEDLHENARPLWDMPLLSGAKEAPVLPLVPGGYVDLRPPFFHPLPELAGGVRALQLALGREHVLLLTDDGTVWGWGPGRHGQQGHGTTEAEVAPRPVEGLQGLPMVGVAAGGWHSVALSRGGDVYTWGWNEAGQLGLPSKRGLGEGSNSPKRCNLHGRENDCSLVPPSDANKQQHGCGTDEEREPQDVSHGEKGESQKTGTQYISIQAFPALLDFPGDDEISAVATGSRHTVALTKCGKLYTWGWGEHGQLGHGSRRSWDEPQHVEFFCQHSLEVVAVRCGDWSTFAMARPMPSNK
uniref:RCC1 domain-containing protein 1 isoform X2 n=1 Tax=Petromyzon marinus TaxID=7757 RepID=A0AAJ7WRT8_PETMA|nr:RCC1 domain-containing protein 1 isoform X2 [Petromyzon marinus]